jgi:hypothetical protein
LVIDFLPVKEVRMDRRELLKSMVAFPTLVAVPTFGLTTNGAKATYGVSVDTSRQIIVWVDKDVMPAEAAKRGLPDNAVVIPVTVPHGMTIDQVVRVCQPAEKPDKVFFQARG